MYVVRTKQSIPTNRVVVRRFVCLCVQSVGPRVQCVCVVKGFPRSTPFCVELTRNSKISGGRDWQKDSCGNYFLRNEPAIQHSRARHLFSLLFFLFLSLTLFLFSSLPLGDVLLKRRVCAKPIFGKISNRFCMYSHSNRGEHH